MPEGRSSPARNAPVVLRASGPAWWGGAFGLRLADDLRGLAGWRRRVLALLLGLLASLALPPLYAVPLLLPAFTGFVWLVEGCRRPQAAFAVGWWFGFAHFMVGNYWIANALLTDAARFGWLIPPVIGGLAAVLAVFPGLAAAAAQRGRSGLERVLVLAIAWTALEWMRGWVFSGYPWNLIGYSWSFSDAMNQFAAVAGIWGLGFITVAAAAMPAALAEAGPPPRSRLGAALPGTLVALALLMLAGIWAAGEVRLANARSETVPGVRLRIVQAAIPQDAKAEEDLREAHILRHLQLTLGTPGFDGVTHVIWPETAVGFLLERAPPLRRELARAAPPGGVLITGAPRAAPETGPIEQLWNSMIAIDPTGAIVGTFDKFHLVPLGEYVPLRRFLPFLSKITPGGMDFSAGPGPRTLRLPGLPPVSPLICYEIIFPGRVADRADRPQWLLNLTNDGWFGTSTGPYQHFVSARLRAVEEGIPLVRAANTGISGVVDAYGRVVAELGLGASGVLDVDLPRPVPQATFYGRFGDWTLAALLGFAAAFTAAIGRIARRPAGAIPG